MMVWKVCLEVAERLAETPLLFILPHLLYRLYGIIKLL